MIKLSNINKNFDQRIILSNVSLSISKNEFVCIAGESGVGKTTLLISLDYLINQIVEN